MRKQKRLLLFVLLIIGFEAVFAQSHTINGVIRDENNDPLPGASILIQSTSGGVITNFDGIYTVQANPHDTLIFDFVGYLRKKEPVDGRTTIDIQLKPDAIGLEEVQIVAYGQQKKVSVVGAITSIGNKDLVSTPTGNVANSLAGNITGLASIQSSGQPGADDPDLYIRGISTLDASTSQPLMMVDGVERDFMQLDPEEIESITVLKDASATAVYGIRGANGVILVTTKRGSVGKAKISASASASIQQPTQLLDFADSYTYATTYNQAQLYDGIAEDKLMFTTDAIDNFKNGTNSLVYPNTDWMDYMFKDFAFQHKENVNITGGTERVKYFVSLGFFSQDGMLKDFGSLDYNYNFGYKRFNYRSNVDIEVTKSTTLALTIGGRTEERTEPNTKEGMDQMWRQIYWAVPFSGSGIVNDKYIVNGNDYIDLQKKDGLDPFYGRGFKDFNKNTLNFDIAIKQKLDFITKGLRFGVKAAYNTTYNHNKTRSTSIRTYDPIFLKDADSNVGADNPNAYDIVYKTSGSYGNLGYSESTGKARNWYTEATLNYNRSFGAHDIGALLLYNQRRTYYPSQYTDLPTGYIGSAFRATYGYDNRYLAEINMGYNGSEQFHPDNRYGLFPALSLGWVMSEENFMQGQDFLSFLKLRGSYGLVGNDRLGANRFLYLPDAYNMSAGGYYFGVDVPQSQPGAAEMRIGNPDLTWETAIKQNYGIDAKFFDNKLSVNADYFIEDRKDILVTRSTIPGYVAANLPAVNLGEVHNEGGEIEFTWRQRLGENFNYFIKANASHAKNKIIFKDEVRPNEPYMAETGKSVGQHFGYKTLGFWQEEHFDVDPTTGAYTLKPEYVAYQNPRPGDVRYKDRNNDGKIDTDDMGNIGFANVPQTSFGGSFGFQYKGFDFKTVWAGATNVSRYLDETYKVAFGNTKNRSLLQYMVDDAWTLEKAHSASYPRISITGADRNMQKSDLWVQDATYIRLKNLELGYSVKAPFMKKVGLNNMRIYFSGYNLLTFSKLKIVDPEAQTGSNSVYPVMKVYNVGLNLKF